MKHHGEAEHSLTQKLLLQKKPKKTTSQKNPKTKKQNSNAKRESTSPHSQGKSSKPSSVTHFLATKLLSLVRKTANPQDATGFLNNHVCIYPGFIRQYGSIDTYRCIYFTLLLTAIHILSDNMDSSTLKEIVTPIQ